jgi:hypothetical protein
MSRMRASNSGVTLVANCTVRLGAEPSAHRYAGELFQEQRELQGPFQAPVDWDLPLQYSAVYQGRFFGT